MRRHVLAVALLLAAARPVAARSLAVENFDAALEVHLDGRLGVTETITARFTGAWNGLYRTIPVDYRTPQGLGFHLRLRDLAASDTQGRPLRLDAHREGAYEKIRIWIPGAENVTRTVVLRYRVGNALHFFDDHDELYWNVTGDEWDVPIEDARAHLTLPWGVAGLRAAAFTGPYRSRASEARIDVEERQVDVRLRRPLGFREGLTVVVGWAPGLVERPGMLARAADVLRANWPFGLPAVAAALMGWLWLTRGRDPRLRPIVVRYAPPDRLSPAELGTFIDNDADIRDITATLVDLAVRGVLTIEEKPRSTLLGLSSTSDFTLHLCRPLAEVTDVRPHERAILDGLFAGRGTAVALSDLENEFYRCLSGIRDRIFEGLVARGWYARRPDVVRTLYIIAAGALASLGVAGAIIDDGAPAQGLGATPLAFALGFCGAAAIVVGVGWIMPRRTTAGTRALEEVLGFAQFLTRVEGDRLERIERTPALFERFLPFAMALGVASQWARAFDGICREPLRWYQGNSVTDFQPRVFVDRLGGMARTAGAAMTSQPRTAGSGSGFGGGGSSGGGFGGGGGGGF